MGTGNSKTLSNDDIKVWIKNGEIHRDGDLPAIIDTKNNIQIWYQHGKRHRDNDRPAYIVIREGEIIEKRWYNEGLLHREGDSPAVCLPFEKTYMWYYHGEKHRHCESYNQDTREEIHLTYVSPDLIEWREHGRLIKRQTKTEIVTYNSRGELHSYNHEPAVVRGYDMIGEIYHENDDCYVSLHNGVVTRREWYENGVLHRDYDDPAVEELTENTVKEWYKHGVLHREDDKPARQTRTSNERVSEWYYNGALHREDDKPAREIIGTPSGPTTKEWYKYGLLHRDRYLPAIEVRNHFTLAPRVVTKWAILGNVFSTSTESKSYGEKLQRALTVIQKFRSKVKKISSMIGMTPKKFYRLYSLANSIEFIEWWYHPDNLGGKRAISIIKRNFGVTTN